MSVLATMLWQAPWLLPVAAATLGVALAAVSLLYPPQLRDVPRAWRSAPLALRVAAILAIAISILQPAVLRPRTASQQGAIVLLIDNSRSMSVSDRGRSTAELIALAGGLGTLPPGARKESAPGLRAQLDAVRARLEQVDRTRGEADYARLSGRGLPGAEARLNDAVDGMREALNAVAIPQRPPGDDLTVRVLALVQSSPAWDEVATRALRSKLDAAGRALNADQAAADEKLFEEDQAVRTACIRTGRLTRAALVELALTQKQNGLLYNLPPGAPVVAYSLGQDLAALPSLVADDLRLQPAAAQSDVTGAVRGVLRALSGKDVQAVVVLSDGRQVGGESPVNADMSALRAPVFAVATAPPGQRLDVAIARVDVPKSVRVGQPMTVRVDLRCPAVPAGTNIDVQLESAEGKLVQRITVGDDWTAAAEFETRFTQAGAAGMTVSTIPLAGEISDQNNMARRWVKVGREPLRVTVISAADAGREFWALHEVLSRASWVTLREVEEADTYRLGSATLASQDLVILCDLPADALWPEQWDALDRLVRERGGTVIMTAGAHLPGGYAGDSPAADWLPFDARNKPAWRTWPGGEPHFRVTPSGEGLWQQLPALARFVPMKNLKYGVVPLLSETSSGVAVVTENGRGAGKVVLVGTDETWRWRVRAGAAESQQFWPALLRHVAPEPYAATAGNLALDADALSIEPNHAVTLRARVTRGDGSAIDQASVTVDLMQDYEPVGIATLRTSGDGRFEGRLEGLDAGDYVLRLDAPRDAEEAFAEPVELPLHVEQNVESELADLAGDDRLLRRVAESSGGRFVTLDQLPALPRLLDENRQKQTQFVEYTLWDSPWLFGFVLACLSTEWALRKRFGLA